MTNRDDTCAVTFEPAGRWVEVQAGATLLDAARLGGVDLASDCGGEGSCGQCRVRILSGRVSPPGEDERAWLAPGALEEGERLACRCRVRSAVTVHVPQESRTADQRLQLEGDGRRARGSPVVRAMTLEAPAPSLEDPRSDLARLFDAMPEDQAILPRTDPAVVRAVSELARREGFRVAAFLRGDEMVGAAPAGAPPLGLAIDLGTTKVACYLLDLTSGRQLAARGFMNPQIAWGEDVISRLSHVMNDPDGARALSECVWKELEEVCAALCRRAGVAREQLAEICIVGNTACIHMLFELPVAGLVTAPFVPAGCPPIELRAREVGLRAAPGAWIHAPPCIGGFVGGDHVAMILACEIDRSERVSVGIDIGTNTEIVLARPAQRGSAARPVTRAVLRNLRGQRRFSGSVVRGELVSTSCASGPAFEGAQIEQGMRAAPGAIESVRLGAGGVEAGVIDDVPATGICGSGAVDAVAELVRRGGIDRRGHLRKGFPGVRNGAHGPELVLIEAGASGTGTDVVLTQRDIGAIQLAKGAVRAGFEALLESTGTKPEEVERVVVAGAFGCHLPIEAVLDIGMFPPLPRAEFEQAGNAAGLGARLMLLSAEERHRAARIARRTRFLELKTTPGFNQRFAAALRFSVQPEPA